MLDEAAGRAHMGADQPRFMFTARLNVQYRKNVPVGKPIRLVGQAGESKRRTAFAHSYIYDENEVLLAEAEAVLVDVPAEMIQNTDLERLGWKIYPE
jgi:acyl-coenzyme A thioesterase PaaI-like protein